jgi:ribosomal protein L40E
MLFKKVCPRCGRRYPKNFPSCLECGATLVDTEKETRKEELKKHIPLVGMFLLCGILITAVLFFVIPLVQLSLASGQEFGTLSKTAGQQAITTYLMNQPASDGNLQVAVIKIRDGARSANSKKFIFVTVTFQNLRSDNPLRVSSGDFILLDAAGNPYPSLGLGEKVAQDVAPLNSGSYDLMFEIPQDAAGLKIQYSFPASGDRSAEAALFLLE